MAMQGFFSQMLGHGAGKSMADYNKQQQINQLLRQGWVPKGQGGITGQPMEEEQPSQEGPESETDYAEIMKEIAETIGDPEIIAIINDMYAPAANPLDTARANASEDPIMNDLMQQAEGGDDDPSMASELVPDPIRTPDFSEGITSATPEDRALANEYIAEIEKDPTARYPTVGGLTIEEQPNALSIQALVSEYTNTLDYDRSVTSFEQQSDPTEVNPDPESRGWVNREFGKIRSKLDGFIPSGKEAGTFLKPIAEQLNSMFGVSTPLDMDGYEMGPYHAQRMQHREASLLDKRHVNELQERHRANSILETHYNNMDANTKQGMQVDLIRGMLTYKAKIAELEQKARELDLAAMPKPEEIKEWRGEVEEVFGELDHALRNTAAQWGDINWWPFGEDDVQLLPYKFRFWDWEDPDEIMRPLNLLLGLTSTGDEDISSQWFDWAGTPEEQIEVQGLLDKIRSIGTLILRSPELRYRKASGGQDPLSYGGDQRQKAFEKEFGRVMVEIMKQAQVTDPLKSK